MAEIGVVEQRILGLEHVAQIVVPTFRRKPSTVGVAPNLGLCGIAPIDHPGAVVRVIVLHHAGGRRDGQRVVANL